MRDNTDDVISLLRGIADALEQNRAQFADYEMYDSIGPHRARETEIEIEIVGFDTDVLLNNDGQ
jgi:hypothetical protein